MTKLCDKSSADGVSYHDMFFRRACSEYTESKDELFRFGIMPLHCSIKEKELLADYIAFLQEKANAALNPGTKYQIVITRPTNFGRNVDLFWTSTIRKGKPWSAITGGEVLLDTYYTKEVSVLDELRLYLCELLLRFIIHLAPRTQRGKSLCAHIYRYSSGVHENGQAKQNAASCV